MLNTSKSARIAASVVGHVLALASSALAQPLTTTFTYQGELENGGSPAIGLHDLRFRLYDALSGGAQQGPTLCADNIAVAAGRFSVLLDFGASFAGQRRFVEIEVRQDTGADCSNIAGFIILGPRQELTTTPHAAFALQSANATSAATAANATQLNGQPASFYTDAANLTGTLPGGLLSGAYAGTVNLSNPANVLAGSGAGLTNLNAASLATGTLPDARLSVNIPRLNSPNTFGSATSFLGNVGIGTSATGAPLEIRTELPIVVLRDPGTASEQAGYISFRNISSETAWVGFGSAGSPDFAVVNARPGGNINLLPFSGSVTIGTTVVSDNRLLTVDSGTSRCASFLSLTEAATVVALNQSTSGQAEAITAVSSGTGGIGVLAAALSGTGAVYGLFANTSITNSNATAVHANGRLTASGTKSFRIDHPADPSRKYLLHYCAESDEVINFYSGNAVLNESGEATVQLPSYFAAINRDPRYTLTPLGAAMPLLHIAAEIDGSALAVGNVVAAGEPIPACSFRIAGGIPGARVSWRVDAVRHDRWVQNSGAPVEVEKIGFEFGTYQHPEFYGEPDVKAVGYRRAPVKAATDR